MNLEEKYYFRDNVSAYLFKSPNQKKAFLELRIGIWNFIKTEMQIKSEWIPIIEYIIDKASTEGFSLRELIDKFGLKKDDVKVIYEQFIKPLLEVNFLVPEAFHKRKYLALGLLYNLGGEIPYQIAENAKKKKILVLTTNSKAQKLLRDLEYNKLFDISIVNIDDDQRFIEYDLTRDYAPVKAYEIIESAFSDFKNNDIVAYIGDYPNPIALRNINRIMIHYEKPWIFATIDGPFLIMSTFVPNETACFECFELKQMTQLRELSEYKNFINKIRKISFYRKSFEIMPLLHLLYALATNEAAIISYFNFGMFVGRFLAIFIPTFEVQISKLLRFPLCPACGINKKPSLRELYFDLHKLIEQVTEKLE